MKKILLVLVALMLSYMPVKAEDTFESNASLNFNNTTFDTGVSLGLAADSENDYYTILVLDGDFTENSSSTRFISAVLYIPTDIFEDGTYDLKILKPSKESNSPTACSDEPAKLVLPSNDKVYIVLADTSLSLNSKFSTVKGTVASSDDGSGTITLSNIASNSGVTTIDGNFAIHTTNSKYSAKVPLSLDLDCNKALKQTVVKVSKDSGSSDATGNFSATILDFSDLPSDELEFLAQPTHPFILKK